MAIRKNYVYTDKKHSTFGIMSCVFGLITLVTFIICISGSYKVAGIGVERYGTAAFLAAIFNFVGLGLGIYSILETERFKFFRIAGMVINVVDIIFLGVIMYINIAL